jgi:sugar lactone lactonase YvrE/enterochelin esterase-like enzyme
MICGTARITTIAIILFAGARAFSQDADQLGPDSQIQVGVPRGEVQGPIHWQSSIFPGTERDYWIYVPAQYDGQKPACVLIVQDGLRQAESWHLTTVLDNLIHEQEIPVTIGVFIAPGIVPAGRDDAQPRFNRSFEYDSMTDRYARLILEEILPQVSKTYRLSDDPNDRAIAGASSGAICAFNVAWQRPDQFRRVISTIGTYVSLRGGEQFASLVRKCEPKPIRVFLEDGSSDLNIYAGDWYLANLQMLSALEWAGYDVAHAWGNGGHSSDHAAAIMPDMLRWLWRDYPDPIKPQTGAKRRVDLVIPGEDWELVTEGYGFTEGPAVNRDGEIFFTDMRANRIHRIDADGEVSVFAEDSGAANGLMFGADGRLYACANGKRQIAAYNDDGTREVICEGVNSNDVVIARNGIYFTDPHGSRIHFIDAQGNRRVVAEGEMGFCNGIVLSPDHTFLYTSDTHSRTVYSMRVESDGSLDHREPLVELQLSPERTATDADGMAVDTEGRIYVTSDLGLQVCDPLGRVNLILAKPDGNWLSNVVFAGKDLDTLYVTCGGKVYRRKVNATGFLPWSEPLTPPRPGL